MKPKLRARLRNLNYDSNYVRRDDIRKWVVSEVTVTHVDNIVLEDCKLKSMCEADTKMREKEFEGLER